MVKPDISDEEWLELQLDHVAAKARYGITLPSLPDDGLQISFTGLAGVANLQQGFKFYMLARTAADLDKIDRPRVLDFGAGWGRVARFFLRDAAPKDIVTSDTAPLAIKLLRETGGVFTIVQNSPFPPIQAELLPFDLIYAFSVFSHLSEKYTRAWLDHLLARLRPSGRLVITTRGERFIRDVDAIKSQTQQFIDSQSAPGQAEYLNDIRRNFPSGSELRHRYSNGEFQFLVIKQHAELIEDCTGETLIPLAWFARNYGSSLIDFRDDADANQCVVILRRSDAVVVS